MNTVIEHVLQLPKEQKLELLYALQEDLNEELGEIELTNDQWADIEKRYKNIENDTSQFISGDEFLAKLTTLRNELHSKRT